ncbi:MAG: hypothetical protein F4X12_13040 [Acidobacteriia bacterium]|nr:hypothetical protein [Terriglobia bacterium]
MKALIDPSRIARMNLGSLIKRIWRDDDFGRAIATAVGLAGGLIAWRSQGSLGLAIVVTIIVFSIAKISARAIQSPWNQRRERRHKRDQLKRLFENLAREERTVVKGFVCHGGSVVTSNEVSCSKLFPGVGIRSLINRDILQVSYVGEDPDACLYALDTELFDYAQTVLDDIPF